MSTKITTRKDGRKTMSYWVTLNNGVRKRQYVYGRTSDIVRKKYAEATKAAQNGHPIDRGKTTLEQFLLEWLPTARKIRESTRYNYAGEIRKHIIPKIGKVRLANLNTANVQQMMDSLLKEGVSPRTTQILRNILSKALKNAEAQNLVRPDIIKYVELETYTPKEREIWGDEDTEKFKEAIKQHKYYFIFLMCLTYGLRRGEAIAIRWDDVDLEKSAIHIRKQYTFVAGKPAICDLKTKNSARDLELLPHIKQELKKLSNNRNGEYVLTDNGNPIKPSSVDYEFKKIKKQNNLPDVTLHSLRHYVATAFKDLDVSIKDAQKILGHSSPLTTMEHYQHSSTESKKAALEKYAQKMRF